MRAATAASRFSAGCRVWAVLYDPRIEFSIDAAVHPMTARAHFDQCCTAREGQRNCHSQEVDLNNEDPNLAFARFPISLVSCDAIFGVAPRWIAQQCQRLCRVCEFETGEIGVFDSLQH